MVQGQLFTTGITNSEKVISTSDAKKGRYVVLILTATFPAGKTRIFTTDFILRYAHDDGNEDRAQCSAIVVDGRVEGSEIRDLSPFSIGDYAWSEVSSDDSVKKRIALAFYIEPDVEEVELHYLGATKPIAHRVGELRRSSVYISSNIDAADTERARIVIERGGYDIVHVSDALTSSQSGITIRYRKQIEDQAREVSQRLMTELGTAPTLMENDLIGEVDLVIWLGR